MPKMLQSKRVAVSALFFLLVVTSSSPQERWQPVYLPTGKVMVEPPAGVFVSDLNAFPINSAISPDGRFVAFLNNGYGHSTSGFRKSIAVHDRVTGLVSDFTEPGTGLNFDGPADICTPFYGIAFSSNGKRLYLSLASTRKDPRLGDRTQNGIRIFSVAERGLHPVGFIQIRPSDVPLPEGVRQNNPSPTPSGLSVKPDPDNPGEDLIYAALTLSDAAVELSSGFKRVNRVFDLHTNPAHPALPAEYPYATALSADGKTLSVSLYNGSAVSVVDLASGKASHLPVGLQQTGPSLPSSHPSHMAVHPSGKAVFVAVENTDLISIIDDDPSSKTYRKATGNFDVRTPEMRDRKLWGAGPNHLTFAPDGKRLFVPSVSNAVAVVRLTGDNASSMKAEIEGYPPTLWYPHTTEISRDGQTLFLTSGKGTGKWLNKPNRPFPPGQRPGVYGPLLLKGSLHALPVKDALANLARYTAAVKRNNQLDPESMRAARRAIDFNPIRHVIYVIKENRTYDQVFGDLENSRADKSCLYFGERFTPNQHKLAKSSASSITFSTVLKSVSMAILGALLESIAAGMNSSGKINYSTRNFTLRL